MTSISIAKTKSACAQYQTRRKIGDFLKLREQPRKFVSENCVVHPFKCGLCDMDYVDSVEHSTRTLNSSAGKHTLYIKLNTHRIPKAVLIDKFS